MSKIGDILNPDDSSRGYEHGYKDGKAGKDRNFSRLPFSPKYLVHPLSDVPADTYIEAYKRGHRDGQSQGKLQEIIPGPGTGEKITIINNHNSHTMRRGIEGQQELLEEHIAFVNGAFENLEEMLSSEERELERLDDEGLDEKFKDTLEEFLEEERSLIEQLKELKEDRMAKCRGWYDQMDEIFS
ncbi:MAG: hypothetical protein IKP04_00720 [Candidatus Methanomethylophilaceae archaeon]|nr:hypothetical protein [Candidatus Methanomethylophilaceae archaeon]